MVFSQAKRFCWRTLYLINTITDRSRLLNHYLLNYVRKRFYTLIKHFIRNTCTPPHLCDYPAASGNVHIRMGRKCDFDCFNTKQSLDFTQKDMKIKKHQISSGSANGNMLLIWEGSRSNDQTGLSWQKGYSTKMVKPTAWINRPNLPCVTVQAGGGGLMVWGMFFLPISLNCLNNTLS